MKNAEAAQRAVDELQGKMLLHNRIRVELVLALSLAHWAHIAQAKRNRARTPTPGAYRGTRGVSPVIAHPQLMLSQSSDRTRGSLLDIDPSFLMARSYDDRNRDLYRRDETRVCQPLLWLSSVLSSPGSVKRLRCRSG